MRILVVEDDVILGDGLTHGLKKHGYVVDWVQDGKEALRAILNERFDVIVLDLGLPVKSGLEVLRIIRAEKINTHVLVLTARDTVPEIVMGLDAGADDYLLKPFDLEELCARIRALQRRGGTGSGEPTLKFKDIEINPASKTVYKNGVAIELSRREYLLLIYLVENKGKVINRKSLSQALYGWDEDVDSNALEVHIHNLRKKLGNTLIKTIRGFGYIIEDDDKA